MPLARILTSTWPGPGSGVGTSPSTHALFTAGTTAARMRLLPPLHATAARAAPSGHATVHAQDRPRRIARRVAREVEGRAHDLGRLAGAPEREPRRVLGAKRLPVPVAVDVGDEGPRHDAVHPHARAEGVGKRDGHGVEPRLGGGVGHDAPVGADRAYAAHVDD